MTKQRELTENKKKNPARTNEHFSLDTSVQLSELETPSKYRQTPAGATTKTAATPTT